VSATPYFPFYPSDYLADTGHLTTEQHGAYLLLLIQAWSWGGTLPNNDKKLALCARLSGRKWAAIRDDILAYFEVDGDVIVSRRMQKEYQKSVRKSQLRSDAGAKGGRAKALKDKDQGLAKAMRLPCHLPEPEPLTTNVVNKKEARKRASRLPEDWVLPDEFMAFAKSKGLSEGQAHAEAEKMRDWSLSSQKGAKLDWLATWRSWINRKIEEQGNGTKSDNTARHRSAFASALSERSVGGGVDPQYELDERIEGPRFAITSGAGRA
jgi:uncharacterized protein YdaU (DUF1376 family)